MVYACVAVCEVLGFWLKFWCFGCYWAFLYVPITTFTFKPDDFSSVSDRVPFFSVAIGVLFVYFPE